MFLCLFLLICGIEKYKHIIFIHWTSKSILVKIYLSFMLVSLLRTRIAYMSTESFIVCLHVLLILYHMTNQTSPSGAINLWSADTCTILL